MNTTVTFDDAPEPGSINFGVGQPSLDLLPVDLVRAAGTDYLANAVSAELNYGPMQGDQRFRQSLADFLTHNYGVATDPAQLLLSAGNSQAIDFVCAQLLRPGDTVFVEELSYFLAFQIFADHDANIVGIPVDEQGLRIDALEQALQQHRPRLLYTIPSFHNPTGCVLPARRRDELVQLSRKHDFLIVADEPYQLLHYDEPPPPPLGAAVDAGTVLSLGSFSKILAPGLRLGWIQACDALIGRLLGAGVLNSGGAFNHVTSHIVRQSIDSGLLQGHLASLREQYARRVSVMDAALRAQMPDLARWQRPGGGYFFWLELDANTDTVALRRQAPAFGTGFQPGTLFSADGGFGNCIRLSFAHYAEPEIREGIERLARLIRSVAG